MSPLTPEMEATVESPAHPPDHVAGRVLILHRVNYSLLKPSQSGNNKEKEMGL